MSIWNLLSWQQKEDIEEAVKELEEAVSKFRYSKVYTEDIDYFFYINIDHLDYLDYENSIGGDSK
ncbi:MULTISPECIES: hypothetical protein [Burkholderia cepacia complex]|uniref:hypothetical protein n=1 Tax=Burkholderia cenocepacia TaxID=95486 RepID=UPI0022377C26|nr:hypothetical protein [Burkholderia cenocepacia]MCW5156395.1 hypothetical protein [Burkholderia cenocepacia]